MSRHDIKPAVRTNGDPYQGISTYAGNGVRLSCMSCGRHRQVAGGRTRKVGTQRFFTCCDCIAAQNTAAASPVNGEAQAATNSPGLISQLHPAEKQ